MPVTFTSRIPRIVAELPVAMDAAMRTAAELIEGRAQTRAPDAPPLGEGLVEAIHTERDGIADYRVVAGNDQVFYGHMVEHGTSHSAPHPFLVPALEESRAEVVELAWAALREL